MRQITVHPNQDELSLFVNYLYAQGIETETEPDDSGNFVLWVLDDDHVARSQELWQEFLANPQDSKYKKAASVGAKKFEVEKKLTAKSRAKVISGRTTFGQSGSQEQIFITLGLIIISFGLFAFLMFAENSNQLRSLLFISTNPNSRALPEVLSGQVWRLITPIFMHGSFLHLFFNVSIMWSLGRIIESRLGIVPFVVLILITALASNFGQYFIQGPFFLGLSGVIFGFVGFAAYIQKVNPWENLGVDSFFLKLAIGWIALGFLLAGSGIALIGNMANWAHLFGFLSGIATGVFFHNGLKFFARAE
ncbi:MAG: rhomboid family intramembrane serine protease [Sumerlaeia bacterium]